jgi:serine/threonine protein kinase
MTELKSEQLYDRFITFLLYNGKGGTYGRLLDNPKRDFVAKLILSMGKDNPVVRMNREVLILFFLNRLGSFWLKMIAYGELKQENYTASVTLAVPSAPPVIPCIIMNKVPGDIIANANLDPIQIKHVMFQLSWGLYEAQQKYGISHGDISMYNVMCHTLDKPKQFTFNLAKSIFFEFESNVMATFIDVGYGRIYAWDNAKGEHQPFAYKDVKRGGTTFFIPPEDTKNDFSKDMFSLGSLFLHLLIGKEDEFLSFKSNVENAFESSHIRGLVLCWLLDDFRVTQLPEGLNEAEAKSSKLKLRKLILDKIGFDGLDLLQRMLALDEKQRLLLGLPISENRGAGNIILHPYFDDITLYDEIKAEYTLEKMNKILPFEDEDNDSKIAQRKTIYDDFKTLNLIL